MEQKEPTPLKKPQIVEMPSQRMAVIRMKGDPNVVCPHYMPALYSTVYGLKKILKVRGVDFKVGKLRARWPDAENQPKDQWHGIYGLPIPRDTTSLPEQQKVPDVEVLIEDWEYGKVAQILHIGPYNEEEPTIKHLREFIKEEGYKLIGEHEEEYIKGPLRAKPENYRTIIRCRVQKL